MTNQEKERVARYNDVVASLKAQGYQQCDLILDMKKVTVAVTIVSVIVGAVGAFLFALVADVVEFMIDLTLLHIVLLIFAFLVLIVLHEAIHGLIFGLYAPHHFKSIQFGVNLKQGVAYCYCGESLEKKQYIIGAAMPGILLGLIPLVISFMIGNWWLFIMSLAMTLGAAGDALVIYKLLTTKVDGDDIVYMDHPTEPGVSVFYKSK